VKKVNKGLDLSQLDDEEGSSTRPAALNATGIDNALDALSLTTGSAAKVEKHPERRFKAAFAAFEERRLKEMDEDGSGQGLRQNQKKERIRKEFEKSEENPFNQIVAAYDASKDDLKEAQLAEKAKIEQRLGGKDWFIDEAVGGRCIWCRKDNLGYHDLERAMTIKHYEAYDWHQRIEKHTSNKMISFLCKFRSAVIGIWVSW